MTLEQALVRYRLLLPVAERSGYLLSIYGSVLTGQGRDLDLIAVPFRERVSPDTLVRLISESVGESWVQRYDSVLGRLSCVWKCGIDLVITRN